jgi:hypothetical protein
MDLPELAGAVANAARGSADLGRVAVLWDDRFGGPQFPHVEQPHAR